MQSVWEQIREGISGAVQSATKSQFAVLQGKCPSLARFRDAGAATDWLQTPEDAGWRDAAYRELIQVVQSTDGAMELATAMLLAGLWAPLDHIYGALQYYIRCPSERASLVCGEFAHQLQSLRLDRVNYVASTLVLNVQRRCKRDLRHGWRESSQQAGDEILQAVPGTDQSAEKVVSDESDVRRVLAAIQQVVGDRDAELIRLAYIVGQPHAVTAKLHGMTTAQVRQRVSRAIRKVQNNSPTWLSQKAGVICMYRKGGSSRTAGATDGDV